MVFDSETLISRLMTNQRIAYIGLESQEILRFLFDQDSDPGKGAFFVRIQPVFSHLLTGGFSPCIMLEINIQPITGMSTGDHAGRDGRPPAESPLSKNPGMSPGWHVEEICLAKSRTTRDCPIQHTPDHLIWNRVWALSMRANRGGTAESAGTFSSSWMMRFFYLRTRTNRRLL